MQIMCQKHDQSQEIYGNEQDPVKILMTSTLSFHILQLISSFSTETHLEFTNGFATVIFSIENKAQAKAELSKQWHYLFKTTITSSSELF